LRLDFRDLDRDDDAKGAPFIWTNFI
jgi:hypothetical protein